jgi:hypothetical protein
MRIRITEALAEAGIILLYANFFVWAIWVSTEMRSLRYALEERLVVRPSDVMQRIDLLEANMQETTKKGDDR